VPCFIHKKITTMAIKITEDCINCGACEPECPNGAIYAGGDEWRFSDKTTITGSFASRSGITGDADAGHTALSNDYYYIVPDKCTECQGFHEEPQCASVCPVDCCLTDEANAETNEELLAKKELLHA
jgi:ferredoxin